MEDVERLPSAQPTQIIYSNALDALDCVSRQAAIKALHKKRIETMEKGQDVNHIWECLDVVAQLPSVQSERGTGEWIEDAKTYYEQLNERGLGVDEYTPYFTDDIACSVCLAKYSTIDNETQFFKFCPNCGARMKGGYQ